MKFLQDLVRRFASPASTSEVEPARSENILAVEQALAHYPSEKGTFLACFALLLGRIALADGEISDRERSRMKTLLCEHADLDLPEADVVVSLALERTISNRLENHLILRELKALTTKEQKQDILRALFALASEDDISQVENKSIRLVSDSFGFTQREFVSLRSEFRTHLAFLRKLPTEK